MANQKRRRSKYRQDEGADQLCKFSSPSYTVLEISPWARKKLAANQEMIPAAEALEKLIKKSLSHMSPIENIRRFQAPVLTSAYISDFRFV